MKRRRLLNLLTLLSALLCAATVALWVRSYRGSDGIAHLAVRSDARRAWVKQGGFVTSPGEATAWWVTYDGVERSPRFDLVDAFGPPGWNVAEAGNGNAQEQQGEVPRFVPIWSPHATDPATLSEWEGLGFRWMSASIDPAMRMTAHIRAVTLPLWFPAAAFAAPPALWLGRRLYHRLRRPRPGLCPRCGYDLRATPGRCPECGTPAKAMS